MLDLVTSPTGIVASIVVVLGIIVGVVTLLKDSPEIWRNWQPMLSKKKPVLAEEQGLAAALDRVFTQASDISEVRMFALTAAQQGPALKEALDEGRLRVGRVKIIICQPPDHQSGLEAEAVRNIKETVKGLDKNPFDPIRESTSLEIRVTPFVPTEYFIIVGSSALLHGFFLRKIGHVTGLHAKPPVLVFTNETEIGRSLIKERSDAFDSWFASLPVYQRDPDPLRS